MSFLTGFSEQIYGLMRIVVGFLFTCHGAQKILFMAHQGSGLLPIQNHGELAVLYCWIFLFIAARGSGALSVDAARAAR